MAKIIRDLQKDHQHHLLDEKTGKLHRVGGNKDLDKDFPAGLIKAHKDVLDTLVKLGVVEIVEVEDKKVEKPGEGEPGAADKVEIPTAEALEAMKREELVKLAKALKIEKPDNKKTADLIKEILERAE